MDAIGRSQLMQNINVSSALPSFTIKNLMASCRWANSTIISDFESSRFVITRNDNRDLAHGNECSLIISSEYFRPNSMAYWVSSRFDPSAPVVNSLRPRSFAAVPAATACAAIGT